LLPREMLYQKYLSRQQLPFNQWSKNQKKNVVLTGVILKNNKVVGRGEENELL